MLEEAFGGDAEGGVLLEAFHEELAEKLYVAVSTWHGVSGSRGEGVY
jgi:hypothetical protein